MDLVAVGRAQPWVSTVDNDNKLYRQSKLPLLFFCFFNNSLYPKYYLIDKKMNVFETGFFPK